MKKGRIIFLRPTCISQAMKGAVLLRSCFLSHLRIFMSDIEDIVKGMVRGRIKGSFTWVKKGSDYGIQLVKVTDRKNGNAEINRD